MKDLIWSGVLCFNDLHEEFDAEIRRGPNGLMILKREGIIIENIPSHQVNCKYLVKALVEAFGDMFEVTEGICQYSNRSGFFLIACRSEIDPLVDRMLDDLCALLPGRITYQEGGSGWVARRGSNGVDPALGVKIVVHLAC